MNASSAQIFVLGILVKANFLIHAYSVKFCSGVDKWPLYLKFSK